MAKVRISPGLKGERSTLVCEHNVAPHMDKLSTPAMIMLMERASVAAVEGHLAEGQTTVGYEVNIRHLAPSSIGATAVAYAELTGVDRNRLTFRVEAYDGDKKIGEGTHRRAVVGTDFGG